MAYKTSAEKRQQIKEAVLQGIAPGVPWRVCGREMYRVGAVDVHARFCAEGTGHYKFNINPNSLSADYELWICGGADHWYLIPTRVLQEMHDYPNAYPDNMHPEIRVVSVDAGGHSVGYAAPGVKLSLQQYFRAAVPQPE